MLLFIIFVAMGVFTAVVTHKEYNNSGLTLIGFIVGASTGLIGCCIYLVLLRCIIGKGTKV
jgi:hypothetical protein